MKTKCWSKMMTPIRKAWTKFSKKMGLRKSAGHVKLQQDVRTCEYDDVHVLWELLKRNEESTALTTTKKQQQHSCTNFWNFAN